jgi:ribonuclease VapC
MSNKLADAVIDSSALLCVALGEPAAKLFLDGFSRTGKLYIGAATRAETWLAVYNSMGKAGAQKIDELLEAFKVETVDFGASSLPHFRQGGADYHRKFHSKARLNIGDLFAYALAKQMKLPLFFQGTDFANTDLTNAMKKLGYEMSAIGVPRRPDNPLR